ncbi:MAG: tetratricopeptide repeat protein [Myxococcales bacterium]|nr:tetratricopeptide repeat protein [Myxococcales bacterium]
MEIGYERTRLAAGDGETTEPSQTPPRPAAQTRGATFGRYVVLDALGEGGMGVVYAAYDPELDRKVAIKLLHPHSARRRRDEVRARLLREAQALARLSHPNVVAVHDVGVVDGDVFVAMEFVDGDTLSAWLHRRPRSWRAIRAVFLEAGRGLAAAHAAGLVHRDFKLDNVMLGRDGRARVMDFGLARGAEARAQAERGGDGERPVTTSSVDLDLTRTGTMLGTPLYMAPEQHLGAPADARSDIFSYAVALYQALYAQRPFAGDTVATLLINTQAGAVRPPPAGTRAPAWLHRIVLRGLRAEPEERYPSMEALLADLARDRGGPRRIAALLGAGALIAGVTAVAVSGDPSERCEGGDDPWEETWSKGQSEALLKAKDGDAAPIAERLVVNLDRQIAAWTEARRDACQATHVRHEQSLDLLDRRMACLERQRRATAQLVAGLGDESSTSDLERALEASYRLPDARACADRQVLLGEAPLPSDPAAREAIVELRAQVAEAGVLRELGQAREARVRLDDCVTQLADLTYPPAHVEALMARANALADLGEVDAALADIDAAAPLAATAGDRAALASLWSLKGFVVGYRQPHPEAGLTWTDAAATLLSAGDPPRRRISALVSRGLILTTRGDAAAAAEAYRAALAIAEAELEEDHPVVGKVVGNLGAVEMELGDFAAAERDIERAVAITRAKLGPRHTDLGHHLLNLSELARHRGDLERAEALVTEALAIRRERLGDAHVDVARALHNLAMLEGFQGRLDDAAAHLEEARAIQDEVLPPDHPDVAETTSLAGSLATSRKRFDEAEAHFRRSLAVSEAAFGPDHPSRHGALAGLANLAMERGDPAEARRRFRELIALREREYGPTHPSLRPLLEELAKAGLEVAPAEAVEEAGRAVAIADGATLPGAERAASRLTLARALIAAADRRRARAVLDEVAALELPEAAAEAIADEVAALRAEL